MTTVKKGKLLYEGKAKRLYEVEGSADEVLHEFKDSLTAFNGEKKASLDGKGALNRDIASLAFRFLHSKGILTHWKSDHGDTDFLTEKVKIIPLEIVVRNVMAGSLAKKLGMAEGLDLPEPILDLHYKRDDLGDPFISEQQAIVVLKAATSEELDEIKTIALKTNICLQEFFRGAGLKLVDFKLEFGRTKAGKVLLSDEISPDTCRLWDIKTGEKRDKDRFRRDLGEVIENYKRVWKGLEDEWGGHL